MKSGATGTEGEVEEEEEEEEGEEGQDREDGGEGEVRRAGEGLRRSVHGHRRESEGEPLGCCCCIIDSPIWRHQRGEQRRG